MPSNKEGGDHYIEYCGQLDKAIQYWREAGDIAFALPAYAEALSHYTSALALIRQLDTPSDWNETELELQLNLAQVCVTKLGYDSKEAALAFARANELLETIDRPDLLVPARYGIWIAHYLNAEYDAAYPLVERVIKEVEHSEDPIAKLVANRIMAATLIGIGEQQRARQHLEQALELYQPDFMTRFSEKFAQEPGIQIRSYLILNLYLLGYADQAEMHLELSEASAKQLNHVNTTCYGAQHWSMYGFISRNEPLARRSNTLMLELAQQHGLHTWLTFGQFAQALFESKDGDLTSLDRLSRKFEEYIAGGNLLFLSYYKTEQVRELLRHGQFDAALDAHRQTADIIEQTHECWYLSELQRLHGKILVTIGQTKKAEESFQAAIQTACDQGAKSLELRAATSLANLWAGQDEIKAGIDLLQPVYDRFDEGMHTPDVEDARAFLQGHT